jgi:hypothetical protein
VVSEQDGAVGAVAGVAKGADAEKTVVDEVTEEDGPPLVRRIRVERLEKALEVAMDVADDQDGQVVRGRPSSDSADSAPLDPNAPFDRGSTAPLDPKARNGRLPAMPRSYWVEFPFGR